MSSIERNGNANLQTRGSELAKFFLTEFPKTVPGRLEWYSKELGLNPYRLLRLGGVPAEEAKTATATAAAFIDWVAILRPYQETARDASNLIGRLFWYFDYDKGKLKERLARIAAEEFSLMPPDSLQPMSLQELTEADQERVLFALIGREDFEALMAYLCMEMRSRFTLRI